jgi:hypothetical protein
MNQEEMSQAFGKLNQLVEVAGEELSHEFMPRAENCYKKPTMDQFDTCVKGLKTIHETSIREFSLRGQFVANTFTVCLKGGDNMDVCLGDAKKSLSVVVRDLKALF